jgi:hypothetical protein
MPLQKITLKPGVNRENTRYTNEGGYYESNLVRFRQGTPEKIGGWRQISNSTFLGVCRSLWNWVTLAGANLVGVGTEAKFYIEQTGQYYDITPINSTSLLGANPFLTVTGSATVTVTDGLYNPAVGDYVIFSGAAAVHGITLNGQYQVVTVPTGSTYTVTALNVATAPGGAGGGSVAYASYLLEVGSPTVTGFLGWGSTTWGQNNWGGVGQVAVDSFKTWSQFNFGENLLLGPKNKAMYYWNATTAPSLLNPTNVTISNATPGLVTVVSANALPIPDGTVLMLETTGALPLPLRPLTTYYVNYLTATTFNISTSATLSATLSGIAITGIAGQFSCTVASVTLTVGQSLTISGTYGGTGSISGYTNPTKYYIVATNGSTTFTLSTTVGGSGVTTTAGTPTGLTYTLSTRINTSSAGSGTQTISIRAIAVSALAGAASVPLTQNTLLVSDTSRFTIVFGTNDYLSTTYDPMLIRWSDQESVTNWTPAITNQAGSVRLSHGSQIQAVLQARQEILVFTDAAVYSLQYLGPPYVWGTQLLSDNISIASVNAASYSNGTAYWMGVDKFYKYDGRVQPLRCDLRQFVYNDINLTQFSQIFSSTNEGFNEIWWFYCTQNSLVIDRYVVYNYVEDAWYYGSMDRTAWLDSALRNYPIAATYANNLVYHENGVDDGTLLPATAINSSITTAQFDIGDGHNFAFIWRMLPDLTFRGSANGTNPSVTMQLQPLQNSGSGYNNPISIGGTSSDGTQTVLATQTYPIDLDTFTGQLNIRIRGRQMSMKIASNTLGTQWQLGSPRIDIRPDGRRGG